MDVVHRVVRYLKGSIGKGILCKVIVIQIGQGVLLLDDPILAITFFLVPISYLGKPRNKLQFLSRLLKLNIEPWLL
jgi:hypothetical protein